MVTYKGKQKEEKRGGKVATHPPEGKGEKGGQGSRGGAETTSTLGKNPSWEEGEKRRKGGEGKKERAQEGRAREALERETHKSVPQVEMRVLSRGWDRGLLWGGGGGGGEGRLVVCGSRSSTKLRMKVKRRRVEGLGFSLASTLIKD